MNRTTIRDLGQRLPIGIPSAEGSVLAKNFVLRLYKAQIDRHLSLWREANGEKPIAYLVTQYVAMVLRSIGDKAFTVDKDGTPTDETVFDVTQLFFADVMYIYVWSRINELDSYIWKPIKCPVCGHVTKNAKFDLFDSDVTTVDSVSELEKWVKLRHDLVLRTGHKTRRVKLRPVRWGVMHHEGLGGDRLDTAGYIQLQHSIAGVDALQSTYNVTEAELDEMRKIDLVTLQRESNSVSAGLDMQTHIVCPGRDKSKPCGFEITESLDWTFDSFFGSSFELHPPTEDTETGGTGD